MRVLRERQMISGFLYEEPVTEIPALTHCGEALCCSGYVLPPHRHPGFEFQYLSRGEYQWQVGEKRYSQTMSGLFIARPNEFHGTGHPPRIENQHLWLGLRLEKLGLAGVRLARQIRRHEIRVLTNCQELELLLHGILCQVVEARPHRAETIQALLAAFIALIEQRIISGGTGRPAAALPYSASVQKVIVYMRQNLDRRLSLRELASVAMMRAPTHFCTRFRREVGVTPSIYHTRLRLEGTREALRQPAADITNVALQFGFCSSQHFSSVFQRAYGVTPYQWKSDKYNRAQ